MSKTLVVVVSDLHVNSTTGLCSPDFRLDNGAIYRYSEKQEWLWKNWELFWLHVEDIAPKYDRVITVFNGDVVDLNKYASHELISLNRADILKNAAKVIWKSWQVSDQMIMIRGTSSHVGNSGELEELLARDTGSIFLQDMEKGLMSFYRLTVEIDGVIFDFSHKGVMGSKSWTKNNPLNALASEVALNAIKYKQPIPNYVIRSHFHVYAESSNDFPVKVIQTPCWELGGEYTANIGVVMPSSIGGLLFSCEEGECEVEYNFFLPETRQPIKL